jgi:hypothetical protein
MQFYGFGQWVIVQVGSLIIVQTSFLKQGSNQRLADVIYQESGASNKTNRSAPASAASDS